MGAIPRWALLSLALPGGLDVQDLDGMVDGIADLAASHGVFVIGGNLTASPGPLVVDMTAVGEAHPRRVLTRGGGRPGDALYVSGTIGGAAAGLAMLQAGSAAADAVCLARYRRPEPRVRLGVAAAQNRAARAAMDLSDGLADAATQVAAASGCGVEIDGDALPLERGARAWWEAQGEDPIDAALRGGDDYELLLAVPRLWAGRLRHLRAQVARPELTRIGVLTRDPAARVLLRQGRREALPAGFDHFGGPSPVAT